MKKIGAIAALSTLMFAGCSTEVDEPEQAPSTVESASEEQAQVERGQPEEKKNDKDVPKEWQAALKKADIYANRMHMSKAGLHQQLTSEYGEKFSPEAAQYAVDNVKTDWNENALNKARQYQDSMHMSPDRIYDQLTSEYGEKFTPEEAQYAVDNL